VCAGTAGMAAGEGLPQPKHVGSKYGAHAAETHLPCAELPLAEPEVAHASRFAMCKSRFRPASEAWLRLMSSASSWSTSSHSASTSAGVCGRCNADCGPKPTPPSALRPGAVGGRGGMWGGRRRRSSKSAWCHQRPTTRAHTHTPQTTGIPNRRHDEHWPCFASLHTIPRAVRTQRTLRRAFSNTNVS